MSGGGRGFEKVEGEAAGTGVETGGFVESQVGLREGRVAGELAEAVGAEEEPETIGRRMGSQGEVEIGQGIGSGMIAAENGGFFLAEDVDGFGRLAMGQEMLDGGTEVFAIVVEERA